MSAVKCAPGFRISCLAIVFIALFPGSLLSANTLSTKPLKCVSLKQGQVCTQRLILNWAASDRGDYCIFTSHSAEPLACWSEAIRGEHRLIYKDNVDWVFTLRPVGSDIDLATSTLTIAWVYDNRRQRSGWRRFWKLF